MKNLFSTIMMLLCVSVVFAGNPDRQGEAGAYELLMNPWARSAGFHTMNTSFVSGVEALRLNPAGLTRIHKTELAIGNTRYLVGTDINFNSFGVAQRTKGGAFGVSVMTVDFGDIPTTTGDQPAGTGGTFSPSWSNIGLSYAHLFENKVSVGITGRGVLETTSNVAAYGFAIDAGVQYVSGENDEIKFGISLRNVGTPMTFRGEGIAATRPAPNSEGEYDLTYYTRSQDFELPSALNIGLSYDLLFGQGGNVAVGDDATETKKSSKGTRVTLAGNFTANSFSRDQIGAGVEFALNDMFMLRGAYKYEIGTGSNEAIDEAPLYTGPSGGVTVQVPMSKKGTSKLAIDYAYRVTKLFDGTHNIGVRLNL